MGFFGRFLKVVEKLVTSEGNGSASKVKPLSWNAYLYQKRLEFQQGNPVIFTDVHGRRLVIIPLPPHVVVAYEGVSALVIDSVEELENLNIVTLLKKKFSLATASKVLEILQSLNHRIQIRKKHAKRKYK